MAALDSPAAQAATDPQATVGADGKAGLRPGAGPTDTLPAVLADAYRGNAALGSARYGQRAVDEEVDQARGGWRPKVTIDADISRGVEHFGLVAPNAHQWLTSRGAVLTVLQPIYHGGAIDADVERAEAEVAAGEAKLSSTTQQQLLEAAQAYLDVYRDEKVLGLSENLVQVLAANQRDVQSTFKAGAATETDTSQASARLQGALASRLAASGNLATSKAGFVTLVGRSPALNLAAPALLGALPKSEAEAEALAAAHNPALEQAREKLEAAKHQVDYLRGGLLPQVDGMVQVQHQDDFTYDRGDLFNSAAVGVQMTMPLYEGGSTYSRIRAAREAVSQAGTDLIQRQREVAQYVTAAWAALQSAQAEQAQFRTQIDANQVALRTTDEQVNAGTRTRLDLLNAQQELFSSRVNLVAAQHDTLFAIFKLETAEGLFTPESLGLSVQVYDAKAHRDAVRDKWIGTMPVDDDVPQPEAR